MRFSFPLVSAKRLQTPGGKYRMRRANGLRYGTPWNRPGLHFYRGATEAAFNQIGPARKYLEAVIRTAPHSEDAYAAHELLASLYFRNGLYHKAFLQIEAMLREKPTAEDAKNMHPLFKALSQSDQAVSRRKPSTLPLRLEQGNLYLPVTIGGKQATYILDTGANFSLLSESEAKRLGLLVRDVNTQIGDSSGAHVGMRVAVAKDLFLGNLHLKNVAFGVLPDTQPPFAGLPVGLRGLLGIPVLLAMQTLRWEPKGTFAFGFRPQPKRLSRANLCFEQSFPVTQVVVQHTMLDFTLDTGAVHTVLSLPFAQKFPDLLKASGQKESHLLTGVGGSSSYDSVLLPIVILQVGGQAVSLKPAHVLVKQSSDTSTWAAGNLGMDLLNQARMITIDFHAMTLSLQSEP
ncbi:MAG: aspartyl protease family protein [Acidobacteriaceae bacterium]|nr:aspartyl protease family protein [Acidobacteriaceae bacterium]